jgi:Tfp pilus assembly protein PilN
MLFLRNSTGIEIGEKDLTIAVARSTFGKMRLVSIHHLAGFTALAEADLVKALQDLLKAKRIPASNVYLSLPRDRGIVRQIQFPADIKRKLPEIVKLQVETISPWPADEIYWDFAAESPKKDQKLLTITIVIVPRTHVDPWIALFKSAGLPLSGATLSSVAQGHGICCLWGEAVPAIVLHREESYTEGILVSGSRIAAFTGPSTGDDVAPKLVVDRLLSAAKMSSSEGARLIVCGNVDVHTQESNPLLPIEDAKPESTKEFGSLAAALLPLKETPFKSNVVPADLRYRESRRRLVPALALGFLTILMGITLLLRDSYQNAIYASQLDGEIKRISPKVKEVAEQEKELDRLSQRYRSLTSQIQNRDYVLETVGELARLLPASAFLASYSYQDGTITISGFAQSASEIQNLLESSPLFKGVEFANSVTREPSGKDRFTLKMVLEGTK